MSNQTRGPRGRMETLGTIACLIHERVPLGFDIAQSQLVSRELAREFVQERGLPDSMASGDLEALCQQVVRFVKGKRYPILDEPPSPYAPGGADRGNWVPECSQG